MCLCILFFLKIKNMSLNLKLVTFHVFKFSGGKYNKFFELFVSFLSSEMNTDF